MEKIFPRVQEENDELYAKQRMSLLFFCCMSSTLYVDMQCVVLVVIETG